MSGIDACMGTDPGRLLDLVRPVCPPLRPADAVEDMFSARALLGVERNSGVELVDFEPRYGLKEWVMTFEVGVGVASRLLLLLLLPSALLNAVPSPAKEPLRWRILLLSSLASPAPRVGSGDTDPDPDADDHEEPLFSTSSLSPPNRILPDLRSVNAKGEVEPLSRSRSLSPTSRAMLMLIVGRMAGLCFLRALPPSSPLLDAVRLFVLPKLADDRCSCRSPDELEFALL